MPGGVGRHAYQLHIIYPRAVEGGTVKPLSCLEYTRQALLTESAITGEQFFGCGASSDVRTIAWLLAIVFYIASGILMLNMLSAAAATEARDPKMASNGRCMQAPLTSISRQPRRSCVFCVTWKSER